MAYPKIVELRWMWDVGFRISRFGKLLHAFEPDVM